MTTRPQDAPEVVQSSGTLVRLFAVAAVLLGALLIVPVQSASAQEKSLVWERFDVDIVIRPDGAFDVTERQTIRFARGTFTFGFREIPRDRVSSISNWSLTDGSGNSYRLAGTGREPFTFTVTEQDSRYIIYWFFPPVAGRSETYTIAYAVNGGLRYYEDGDQLWWQAIYGERTFPVREGRVHLSAPAPIQAWAALRQTRKSNLGGRLGNGHGVAGGERKGGNVRARPHARGGRSL